MIVYQKTESVLNSLIGLIKIKVFKGKKNIVQIKNEIALDIDLCNSCKLCVLVCAKKAIIDNGKSVCINKDLCIHCYDCERCCPKNAILIKRSEISANFKNN